MNVMYPLLPYPGIIILSCSSRSRVCIWGPWMCFRGFNKVLKKLRITFFAYKRIFLLLLVLSFSNILFTSKYNNTMCISYLSDNQISINTLYSLHSKFMWKFLGKGINSFYLICQADRSGCHGNHSGENMGSGLR